MTTNQQVPTFEQMPFYFDEDKENFVPMLAYLSSGFAAKDPVAQLTAVETNLDRITENTSDTAVFVHAETVNPEERTGTGRADRIVSTVTSNRLWTPTPEGWVDDVVTLPGYEGLGFARAGMNAVHSWFEQQGVSIVRLTSAPARGGARTLYEKLGYVEGGQVWRAQFDDDNTSDEDEYEAIESFDALDLFDMYALLVPPHQRMNGSFYGFKENVQSTIDSETSQIIVERNSGGEISASAIAANCRIPTGNKAWLYNVSASNVKDMICVIRDAHAALASDGVTSTNYMTFGEPDEAIVEALKATGYEPRKTGLYTIDLSQQPAAA